VDESDYGIRGGQGREHDDAVASSCFLFMALVIAAMVLMICLSGCIPRPEDLHIPTL
jgi:hypothetical protein